MSAPPKPVPPPVRPKPVPPPKKIERGCGKTKTFKGRREAREELLRKWESGDFTLSGSHWCPVHRGFHLTKKMTRNGNNYAYRE
jgi:hypothetical protein